MPVDSGRRIQRYAWFNSEYMHCSEGGLGPLRSASACGVDTPVVAQMRLLMIFQTIEIPQLHVDMVIDDTAPIFSPCVFALGLFPGWVMVVVRQTITPGLPTETGGNLGEGVRLTRKTRRGVSLHSVADLGHPTPRRWKRLWPPSSEGEGGEVGVPRYLFPRHGVG